MVRLALAVVAASAMLCARGEAAVYTQTTGINVGGSDIDGSLPLNVFLPSFDSSRGILNSITFSLTGSVDQTTIFYQGVAPTSGVFVNQLRFNIDAPIALGTTPILSSVSSPNAVAERFPVAGSSATYLASTGIGVGLLSVGIDVGGRLDPVACCGYSFVRLTGQVTTTFDYTAVPEPISASLLLAPAVALGLIRRRG